MSEFDSHRIEWFILDEAAERRYLIVDLAVVEGQSTEQSLVNAGKTQEQMPRI